MISKYLERIGKLLDHSDSSREFRFARVLKLTEEVGELSQAVLATQDMESFSYKKKSDNDVISELADVFVTTLAVLKTFDFNLEDFFKMVDVKLNKWENIVYGEVPKHVDKKRFIVFQGSIDDKYFDFSDVLTMYGVKQSSDKNIYFITEKDNELSDSELNKLHDYFLVNPNLIILEPGNSIKEQYVRFKS